MRRMWSLVLPLMAACGTLAPTYERPRAPVPARWPTGAAYGTAQGGERIARDVPWRQFILDARLQRVIEQALRGSRELRKVVADVEVARATYRVQHSGMLPSVQASVGANIARSVINTGAASGPTVRSIASGSATLGVSAFELDLFGRVRSLSDAALEQFLATEATARATRISLIAETTAAWLTLAADRERLAIAQATVDSADRSRALTNQRLDLGAASAVDVEQAESIYQQARADVASLQTSVAQDQNALELLAGGPVEAALLPEQLPAAEAASWLADVPVGLSSQVLLARPDVEAAEHQLIAANANIGAARAAFFPKLALTGEGGVATTALTSLLGNLASIWSIVPQLTLTIFDNGKNSATLDAAHADKRGYVATYELAIQTAFKEVADALARRGTLQAQLDADNALVGAASRGLNLAQARYSQGVDTFLNTLDAQRTLYAAQSALVGLRLSALDNRVTLYRVLGGGLAGEPAGAG